METLKLDYRQFPVLVVDDEEHNLEVFRLQFRRKFDIHTASSPERALALVRPGEWEPAVVVADQRMPGCTGIELLRQVASRCPETVGILLTAYSDWDVLLEALHSGTVYRYLTKPWARPEMEIALQQAIERFALGQENRRLIKQLARMNEYLEDQLKETRAAPRVIGERGGLARVMGIVRQVAASPTTVLLRGESGTGKEVIARAIHDSSPRAHGPFIKVSCAALSPNLLESELFGHEKGAFTGAVQQRSGRFELAHRGTIFLDEVGDLPPDVQVKLLRVLQEREFERVGGTRTIPVDVRVIAATHRDLEAFIRAGQFREDLYYRLNVVPIFLPPLRERPQDIPELVQHFVDHFSARTGRSVHRVSAAALARLIAYPWPGNVRELQNMIERAVILSRDAEIDVDDLTYGWGELADPAGSSPEGGWLEPGGPAEGAARGGAAGSTGPVAETGASASAGDESRAAALEAEGLDEQLHELERRRILAALERAGGRKAVAARELGLSRTTLYYRLKKHGLLDEGEDDPP